MNRSTFVNGRVAAFELEEDALAAKEGEVGTDWGDVNDLPVPYLTAMELQVYKTFVFNFLDAQQLSEKDMKAMDSVFGPIVLPVFEMLEEERVFVRQGLLTGRVLIQVCGKKGTYWIPPGHSVCQCLSFMHKKDFCKHILAAHLCLASTPKEGYKEIDDAELTQIYKQVLGERKKFYDSK